MTIVEQLEHEAGLRPLGEYPAHCDECARVSRQASCEHEPHEETLPRLLCEEVAPEVCRHCGILMEPPT